MASGSNAIHDAAAHFQRGEFERAASLYRLAIKRQPERAALHYNLGSALLMSGQHVSAADAYRRAIELEPDNVKFRRNCSAILRRLGRDEESLALWHEAIRRQPASVEARLELARSLLTLRRVEQAVQAFRDAASIDPGNAMALTECARVLVRVGKRDEAKAAAEQVRATATAPGDADVVVARLAARDGHTGEAQALLECVMSQAVDEAARGRASLELASLLEKQGYYERAFAVVEQGQAALFSRLSPSEQDLAPAETITHLCRSGISADVVSRWKPPAADGRRDPAFIVGFPRSGTTLLEQMLSAHPNLIVTDELPLVQRVKDATIDRLKLRQPYPASLSVLSERQLAILRDTYFESAGRTIGEAALQRRIVDKSPLNTTDLCTVRRIFPDARVIVALRDPRDAVLSAFFQSFARGTPHFYGFESTARLYAMIMDLWLHYREVLGLKWIEVRYEDVVAQPEAKARAMVEFIGEPWNDAVLRYHAPEHRRYVTTPSFEDVAKPVYATSLKRWERYRPQFERVREVLEPFVREFGYGSW